MCFCAEKLELDDMQAEHVKNYDGTQQYAKDKRRMAAYCEEFARRWQVPIAYSIMTKSVKTA